MADTDNFSLARQVGHLIVQPADDALNPPESYLFIQDGLIILCGGLYALCYIFCMTKTIADKKYPASELGGIQFLSMTMAYELFYAFIIPSTWLERLAFLGWFELDITFAFIAIRHAHKPEERWPLARNIFLACITGIACLYQLTQWFPDEREQVTAYWTGILMQLPIGYCCLITLWKDHDTAGHSPEIWLTKYVGCYAAYAVFFWRYWNIPQNWEYVNSPLSIWIIVLTLIPETIYPFVYIWVHKTPKAKTD